MHPTVLIVDDSESHRYLLRLLLEKEGLGVLAAADGHAAIALAARNRLALVLLDLQMPALDGYETAALLQALPGMKDVPLVAVTANAAAGTRERVAQAGFAGYFTKPIDPHTFILAIRRHLQPSVS